jgi:hypothetical protein
MRAVVVEIPSSRDKYNNRLVGAAAPFPEQVWRLPVLPIVVVVFLAVVPVMPTLRDDATNPFKRAGLESRIGY